MKQYVLDTNTVSCLVRKNPTAMRRAGGVPVASLCVSAITAGELLFGLAKRPEATRLRVAVNELLRCVEVLPWNSEVAEHYAKTRAALERQDKALAPLDLLIASHAACLGAVLVTNDQVFRFVDGLRIEDWTVEALG